MAAVGWLALVSVAGVEGVCEAVDRDLTPTLFHSLGGTETSLWSLSV